MTITEKDLEGLSPELRKKLEPLLAKQRNGQLLNFIGAKGGVGTTTIAVNVAVGLCERKAVALVDMNPLFGEVPIFLNIEANFDWGEIVKNISRLDATFLTGVLAKHKSGISVLPCPERLDGYVSAGTVKKLLLQMKELFDYVIIDSGRQLDDNVADITSVSSMVFLVTNLTLPCVVNAKRLFWSLMNMGFGQESIKLIVIETPRDSKVSVKKAEKTIGKEIFWVIPENSQIAMAAIDDGQPILCSSDKSDISKSIREMVKHI